MSSLISDLKGLLGGNNIFNNNSNNTSSGLLGSVQGKVSTLKNLGPYLLIGAAVVAVIVISK